MSNYDNVKEWRRNTKLRLMEGFGGKCGYCKCVETPAVYDFHHLEVENKEFSLTGKIRTWDSIITEAKKCVMLCANCHRKVHAGAITLPENIQLLNESLICYKMAEFDDCPICNNKKPISQKTCSMKCSSIRRTKIKWDSIDLKELLAVHGTARDIGKILGVSDVTVGKRLKKLELW